MDSAAPLPRIALLAQDAVRRDGLTERCRATLPGARIEPVRDMVDLMIRVAAGTTDIVVIDGQAGEPLPEEGATMLKGLHATLQVVIVDAPAGIPVPHRVDKLLDSAVLGEWLARQYPEGTS